MGILWSKYPNDIGKEKAVLGKKKKPETGLRTPRVLGKSSAKSLVADVLRLLRVQNPEPKCELYHETPFQLLVSVVLSAQTTDKAVNRCMEPLHKGGLTPGKILTLGEQGFFEKIKTIGLARTKAKNVLKLSRLVVDKHGCEVPSTREELESLPGVGRKTASVILGELFGEPTIAVDTHVLRVTRRLGLHRLNDPTKVEKRLLSIVDKAFLPAAHHWFILHGRYTCLARNPRCETCILAKHCPSLNPAS